MIIKLSGMYKYIFLLVSCLSCVSINAQERLKGAIFDYNDGKPIVLEGATIHWEKTNIATLSNYKGQFSIKKKNNKNIIVSFVGMKSDTIAIDKTIDSISVTLIPNNLLKSIEITAKVKASQFNLSSAINELKLNEKELYKAACCNLSESFETNASVDVTTTDAATGSKQIKMLGLAGKYVMISKDNIPNIRGYNTHMGMMFIPGAWISGISLTKGIGSVVNGHEDLTGQINVGLIQPDTSRSNDYNLYINNEGRIENNLVIHDVVNKHWQSNVLIHQNSRLIENDNNKDGFIDLPIGNQMNLANLWKGKFDNGWITHIGINYTKDDKIAGTLSNSNGPYYAIRMNTRKADTYFKSGKIFKQHPGRSLGIQASHMYYEHSFRPGTQTFKTYQNATFFNFIFVDIIGNTNHQYKVGVNATNDNYDQILAGSFNDNIIEQIGGVFAEYQLKQWNKLTWIIGGRTDYSTLWGVQTSPRTHIKYEINDRFQARLSSGRGFRTAFALAENQSLLITNRLKKHTNLYNLESSWTHGLNLMYQFEIGLRKGTLNTDYYLTIIDGVVADQFIDVSNNDIEFRTNIPIESNTFQIEWFQELSKKMEIRTAYKLSSVKQLDDQESNTNVYLQQILTPLHRGFANIYYETRKQWEYDYTIQLVGNQTYLTNAGRQSIQAPAYWLHNTQVTRSFNKKNAVYMGIENIWNYRQDNAIQNFEDPSDRLFDATQVWAPIFGRTIYMGLRYKF
jgi:outer membrane cobalamin receptor